EAAAHTGKVVSTSGHDIGDRRGRGAGGARHQHHILPGGVEVPIVPGNVFVHHWAGCRMGGDVLDWSLAKDPDPAPVAQSLPILGPRPHAASDRAGAFARASWMACH